MTFSFEVLEKDIAGRIGRITCNGKTVRTPALLPVINPHLNLITPDEMQKLGVEAIITNAYIFSRSSEFRDQALKDKLSKTLGFDGVIMTDSGSFQLSVYGEVQITNAETIAFQQAIGSDIIVPLDIPTHPDATRDVVEQDLKITLERIIEAQNITDHPNHTLAAPVQGGLFPDIREETARKISDLGIRFCPIGAVVPLMESYRYSELVKVVMAAKKGLSPAVCVHLFGAGHPSMFALAVAMGCDLFDSAAYALYAKDGRYMTSHGSYHLNELTYLPCPCPVCQGHTAKELNESPDRTKLLAMHNLRVTLAEINRVRQAIRDGVLWELVDERCRSHPALLKGYRTLLEYSEELVRTDRETKRRFFYRGSESCMRTEVLRYQQLVGRFEVGNRALISFSRHIKTRQKEGFDTVFFFRPPFGPFPQELSETFPIGQSEIPDFDEEMIKTGCNGIRVLIEANPDTHFTIRCRQAWRDIVTRMLPTVEIVDERS